MKKCSRFWLFEEMKIGKRKVDPMNFRSKEEFLIDIMDIKIFVNECRIYIFY